MATSQGSKVMSICQQRSKQQPAAGESLFDFPKSRQVRNTMMTKKPVRFYTEASNTFSSLVNVLKYALKQVFLGQKKLENHKGLRRPPDPQLQLLAPGSTRPTLVLLAELAFKKPVRFIFLISTPGQAKQSQMASCYLLNFIYITSNFSCLYFRFD